jgi:hypothetical protein
MLALYEQVTPADAPSDTYDADPRPDSKEPDPDVLA